MDEKQNANPVVHALKQVSRDEHDRPDDEQYVEAMDRFEVFEMLRHLNDPEHPLTLEQLNVIQPENIHVDNERNSVSVNFTPTIPHCSMATLIGLSVRVKLLRSLPARFKVDVQITPGAHASEDAVNKQLADKERVAAALENGHLLQVVNKCVSRTDRVAGMEEVLGFETAAA